MNPRSVELSKEEEQKLKHIKKHSASERERDRVTPDRAHALLLSSKGHSIELLSRIFEVRRATVSEWFNRWEEFKLDGLADAPKSGRPTIYTAEEQKK